MLLNFFCQKISFLCKRFFYRQETDTMKLATKIKVFRESISCFMNVPYTAFHKCSEKKFHSLFLPLVLYFRNI